MKRIMEPKWQCVEAMVEDPNSNEQGLIYQILRKLYCPGLALANFDRKRNSKRSSNNKIKTRSYSHTTDNIQKVLKCSLHGKRKIYH
jgi:hypothetical protein